MKDERDLGLMLHRLLDEVFRREQELLDAHHLPMWDYSALIRLEDGPAPTQSQLAAAMGRDKTRLIQSLDRLEERKLIRREPDPADRRNRIVSLTSRGRRLLATSRADIRAMERQLLAGLPAADRTAFVRSLRALDDTVTDAG